MGSKVSRVKNDINMVAVSPLFTTFTPTFIMGRYKVSITKNQYRYHFPESRNHQRESKSIGFIFPPGFYVLLALKRLKFFKFWVCLGVLRVNRKFINYFISSVFVSGLREPVVHLYFQFNFVSWMKGSESCLKKPMASIEKLNMLKSTSMYWKLCHQLITFYQPQANALILTN